MQRDLGRMTTTFFEHEVLKAVKETVGVLDAYGLRKDMLCVCIACMKQCTRVSTFSLTGAFG